jgi:hypothetical protein
MSDSELYKLEAKYWSGESSLEEEERLKKAALEGTDALSAELVQILLASEESSAIELDANFEDEFWAKVEDGHSSKLIRHNFTPLQFFRYAAAALVILCFGAGIWYSLLQQGNSSVEAQTAAVEEFESPEEAFEEAKRALSFASEKLNKAKKPVRKIEKFHQATLSVAGMSNKESKSISNDENNK